MKAFAAAILATAAVALKIKEPTYSDLMDLDKYDVPELTYSEIQALYDLEAAQKPTYTEAKAALSELTGSELEELYKYAEGTELAQEYDYEMPTYSEMVAMLDELSESDLAELYEMYKAYGPPPQYSDYEMPTYSEMEAYLYELTESDLAELYDMYKAYGPPPKKEAELAQEGEEPTYSEAKAALYELTESELADLYAYAKA